LSNAVSRQEETIRGLQGEVAVLQAWKDGAHTAEERAAGDLAEAVRADEQAAKDKLAQEAKDTRVAAFIAGPPSHFPRIRFPPPRYRIIFIGGRNRGAEI
jgi:hypothetical protein